MIREKSGEYINLIDKNDPLGQKEDEKLVQRHQQRLREIKEKEHSMLTRNPGELDDYQQ